MIGRNVSSVLLRIRNLVALSCSANDLHSSYRQCLRSNSLSAAPVKLAYTSYESVKENEQNLRPPIIIMHGLFGSKNNWNTLSKTIHEKTKRKVIAVDARNHGDSPHSPNMSYNDMAADVIQLMHDLGLEKALLIGHSMGGSAMMYTALNYPHNVEKLVVVDMSPISTSPNLLQMVTIFKAMRSINVNSSPNLPKARQLANEQFSKFIKSTALRQFLIANLVKSESGKYRWRVNLPVLEKVFATQIAMFPNVNSKVFISPTLFIGGGNSDYIRMSDHESIKELYPQVEFHYIDGANHWVHADKPNEFVDILTNFVNRPSPS